MFLSSLKFELTDSSNQVEISAVWKLGSAWNSRAVRTYHIMSVAVFELDFINSRQAENFIPINRAQRKLGQQNL
jgi:hypothetical protein